jgi:hypothetical protein
MVDAQPLRRARERGGTRHREEVAQIIPVEVLHICTMGPLYSGIVFDTRTAHLVPHGSRVHFPLARCR